jgi:diguanylate cyclase (GGDEF)-like protein
MMKRVLPLFLAVTSVPLVFAARQAPADRQVTVVERKAERRVDVSVGGQPFTSYISAVAREVFSPPTPSVARATIRSSPPSRSLLSQARPDGFYRQTIAGLAATVVDPRAHIGHKGPSTYVASAGESLLISKPAQLLERLYAGAHPEEQSVFGTALLDRVNRTNARVVARTLAATGNLQALHATTARHDVTAEEIWRGLIHTLRYEPSLFNEQELRIVEELGQARQQAAVVEARERAEQARRDADALAILSSGGMSHASVPLNFTVPQDPTVDEAKAVIARIRYVRLSHQMENQRVDAGEQDGVGVSDEALLDDLVGLPTRRVLQQEFAARTSDRDLPVSLALFDIDHFKSVNDDHGGHATGDEALVSLADVARWCVKGKGGAFRFGGDEFVLLLPNHSLQEGIAVAERFRRAVEASPRTSRHLTLTVSVGVAQWPVHGEDFESLLKAADAALYDSKKRGRNLVRGYGEPEPPIAAPREPERRQPDPGGLSAEEQRKIRGDYFRNHAARCPRDEALLDVHDVTAMGQSRNSLSVYCPLCGLSAELE